MLEAHKPAYKRYKLTKLIDEFAHWIEQELDFLHEAQNMENFRKRYKNHKILRIPRVYKQYTTENMIVMEYADAISIGRLARSRTKVKRDIKDVLRDAFIISLEQVFVYGQFHADPHPGNILIDKEGRIVLIDFGIVGEFGPELRQQTLEMFYAVLTDEADMLVDILLDMSLDASKVNYTQLQRAVRLAIAELQKGDISEMKVGAVFEEVLHAAVENGIRIPREFVIFAKSLILIEGVALAYDPHFNVVEHARPFIENLIKQQLEEKVSMKALKKKVASSAKAALGLPGQVTRILKKLESGSIQLKIQDTDIKRLAIEIDRSSNRIAYATIIAAFVVGGALIMNIGDFTISLTSVLALVMFVLAGVLGLTLFMSIRREQNME
jgi:ubiquinone biosynthesis protein